MSSPETMKQIQALTILRRVVPWASDLSSARDNYKGVRGRIGIVGGARDYAGAPYFASISAMRMGADLAYVICSEKAGQVIKGYSPDLIVTPILDHPDETVFNSEMDCLLTRLHALVIGPGLGRETLLQRRAKKLIESAKTRSLPLVLDADSLLLINEDPTLIQSYPKALLTPNRIELQRLLESVYAPKKFDLKTMKHDEIMDLVKECSTKLNVTILAKGLVDIISTSRSDISYLTTDKMSGSSRRCGGQGDILSGLAGVYMHWIGQSRWSSVMDIGQDIAAWAGYLAALTTRKTNELAHAEFGAGMLASHMIEKIHIALERLLDEADKSSCEVETSKGESVFAYAGSLTKDEINRYRRQMIMQDFGPDRQIRLRDSSALIVGAGGLGCPVAIYLAAGGMGRLGLVDHDVVEVSNLHRQILHNVHKIGWLKTESIKESILAINPDVRVQLHSVKMDRHNAVSLIENYDMVIDATDNLQTRYMISDACVVAKKPLISGAALGMDGQLTVYNYDKGTPCFRCLFPEPPPSAAIGSCSENGVLGVVPGVIGVQQAMEAIRLATGMRPAYAGKMLLFDGQLGRLRQVTLSARRQDCWACGSGSSLGRDLVDYEALLKVDCPTQRGASSSASSTLLAPSERLTLEEYCDILKSNRSHVLIDVRPLAHSDVSRFAHAIQIPVNNLKEASALDQIRRELAVKDTKELYVVCRRGVASQMGVRLLQESLLAGQLKANNDDDGIIVKDLIGGMTGWARQIDPSYTCL